MLAVNKLNMTSTDWGGALSTFAQDYGHDGQALPKVFEYETVGLSMTDVVELLKIPEPNYTKIGSIRVSQRYFGAFRCFSWVI